MKHYWKNVQNMKCPFTNVTKLTLVELGTAQRSQTYDDGSVTSLCTSKSKLGKGSVLFHHCPGRNNLHYTKFTADVYVALLINKGI
jgi:hypothetical protein